MNREKEKLYRKINKKVMFYHGNKGGSYCYDRNSKEMQRFEGTQKSMRPLRERAFRLDYTPLYKFLLSKVGQKWDDVFSEAKKRLINESPIFHLVRLQVTDRTPKVTYCGDSSQYSILTVDEEGILVKLDENAVPGEPHCNCYTHTFNGEVMPKLQ